jgi:hypothetical protein
MIAMDTKSPDAFELVHGFVTASLQGELSDGEVEDFEALLRDNAELRRVYARYLETTAQIPRMLAATASSAPFDLRELSRLPRAQPLRAKPRAVRSPVLGFLNGLLHAGRETPVANALMWLVMAVVCSGMLLAVFFCISLAIHGVGVHVRVDRQEAEADRADPGAARRSDAPAQVSPPFFPAGLQGDSQLPAPNATVARLINAAESRWAIGSHSPHVGDDLEPGRKLVLLSGLAEVMFQSGVRALLQGPATMEIGSRKSAMLHQGKLTVRIEDPDAHGFEVYTRGMKYTDLGTEFGVWVKKDGSQEMLVYRGSVQAEKAVAPAGGGSGTGDESPKSRDRAPDSAGLASAAPIVLTANQAIRVAAPDKPAERIESEPGVLGGGQFVRAMPAPVPITICGTGFALDRGAADPHWELVDISSDANFKPQPAVVADPLPIYLRPGSDGAQWISKSQSLRVMPDACRCTYRTHFDLTGFDASTARIEGRILVDDYVAEIRLNGTKLPAPAGARGPYRYAKWLDFRMEEGFIEGDNTLEVVVENSSNAQQGYVNTMALCIDCKGTARPLLALKSEK